MVDMDDIDPEKARAALEQLEAEKERRLQAKIDAGEMVKIETVVVVGRDEDEEEATARAIAKHPGPEDGRPVHREFYYIFTGVPRGDPDQAEPAPQVQTASSEGTWSPPSAEPAASGPLIPHSQPTPAYVRVVVSNGNDDGDPGAIAEAWYTVEDGLVVLRDADDKHITSRALLKGEDPLPVARALLREAEAPKDFNRPIHYPKLGLA
jgi:hypothetical protein